MDNEIQTHLKPLNMQLHAAISVDSLYKGELLYKAFVLWGKKVMQKQYFQKHYRNTRFLQKKINITGCSNNIKMQKV